METKDYVLIIGITVTFIMGVANLFYNFHINKKTTFINCITSERVKWISDLRNNIAEFCGLTHHYAYSPIDESKKNEIREKIDKLRMLIPLQLNPKEDHSVEIIKLLNKIPLLTDEIVTVQMDEKFPLEKELDSLVLATQCLLKEEWDRVKDEAEKGKV